jgi:putative ABC transport system permease protein
MIYLKLAYRNLTRSLRDYAIYFFTVVISVVIFYSFNSLKDQPVIVDICRQAGMDPGIIGVSLGATSVFVSFIVAALVLYSNNFIIRRRKREWGTYLLLGMKQGKVARMLFIETLAVGGAACAIGIVFGILFSGVFSIFFALLMGAALPTTLFAFSATSAILTVVFYGFIFVGVGIAGSITVSRYSLASLLVANRSNEVYKSRNRWVTGIFGLLSLAILGTAYALAIKSIASPEFDIFNPVFFLIAALVIVGSFGFFYAGIGFIFSLLKRIDHFHWRGLNAFTMQQIMKKINSNTLVLTATNLLLAMTITSVVFLLFFQTMFEEEKNEGLPYAYAVLWLDPQKDLSGFDQAAAINPDNPLLHKLSVTTYPTEVIAADLQLPEDIGKNQSLIQSDDNTCSAIGLSEYNGLRAAKQMEPIQLSENELAVQIGSMEAGLAGKVQKAMTQSLKISLAGSTYSVNQVIPKSFVGVIFKDACALILPDSVANSLSKEDATTTLMFDYANGKDALVEKSLEEEIYRVGYGYWTSSGEEIAYMQISQTLIMFSGLYLELILLMACGSVLGLQQLIETVESIHNYQTLRNLGADDGSIKRSILQQVSFYFFTPVLLAIVHSLFALGAFNRLAGNSVSISLSGMVGTFAALIAVYGIYYLITWRSCVNMALPAREDV